MAPKPYNKYYTLNAYCNKLGIAHNEVVFLAMITVKAEMMNPYIFPILGLKKLTTIRIFRTLKKVYGGIKDDRKKMQL